MSSNMACWNIHHRERCPSEENTSMANSGIFQLAMFDYRRVYGYGSIPINTIFRGMNIHLPAISMFIRGTRFWHTAISMGSADSCYWLRFSKDGSSGCARKTSKLNHCSPKSGLVVIIPFTAPKRIERFWLVVSTFNPVFLVFFVLFILKEGNVGKIMIFPGKSTIFAGKLHMFPGLSSLLHGSPAPPHGAAKLSLRFAAVRPRSIGDAGDAK